MNKPNDHITEQQWRHIVAKASEININPMTLLPPGKGFIKPSAMDVVNFKLWTGYSTTELAKILDVGPSRPKSWMATKNPSAFKPIVSAYWWYLLSRFNVIELELLPRKTQQQKV